ncbi:DUF3102 domain-containing protein [Neorhizobium petrolearium]|uniref:DUF3102 domain-containing protein n=1 Tax=Neorhizobium petrolearium TaxID=515361 RepID=A0ABY8LZL6_9HYPH|nr:DUF3102 domain-containing protein [Neorhizobium petrolearium]MCC2612639.1 DUF3102 domain-containing protein [Neorhizobium petrolearium]WGI67762.1 DUF3102 domain-containing protein [Neorhizobium petrolearium]
MLHVNKVEPTSTVALDDIPHSVAIGGAREARVRAICAEFGIEIIPGNEYPKPGQTRATASIDRIMQKHGEGHARLVLSTLSETKGNHGLITQTSLWAASDLILACSEWIETDLTSWFDAWDKIPMGFLMWHCNELSGISHQRHALAGAMYVMLVHYSRGKKADKEVDYSFMRRIQKAEEMPSPRDMQRQEAIALGLEFIRVKESLPAGEWLPWVREKAGVSYATALNYMRLARSARS